MYQLSEKHPMTTRLHQLRSQVESRLDKYPCVLEAISAVLVGLFLAAATFGAGAALVGVTEAIIASAGAFCIGLVLGWILASLVLGLIFLIFALVYPKSKGIIFVSAGVALAGTAAHWVFNGISFLAAVAYFCLFYLLSAVAYDILLSLWVAGRRIVSAVRSRNAKSGQ